MSNLVLIARSENILWPRIKFSRLRHLAQVLSMGNTPTIPCSIFSSSHGSRVEVNR